MSNNELILNKIALKALATAESVVAFQDGDYHKLVAYPKSGSTNMFSTFYLRGNVYGGGAYERQKYASSSCHIWRADIFRMLKDGDAIELEWHPDNNSPANRKRGLVRQELYLVIIRKKGTKGDIDRIKVLIDVQVQDMNDSWLMCKGYDIKRTCEYDAA
jgi:hypothetical protein